MTNQPVQRLLKRIMDITGSLLGLVLFSPVLLYTAHRIKKEMGSPIFYNRERAGTDGKPFMLYKFRTMTDQRDANGDLLPDADRLTLVGIKIRSSSIDELPQLLNVLKGEMSLVGPRPLLLEYVPLYNTQQKKRLSVTPGLTCYWQVQPSRNDLDFGEWFELDMKYLRERSMKTDIKIIFQTILVVLHMEGV